MRLAELRIENFRSFEDDTIRFDDYTCLVGPNGSGKSAILMALNVLFRENAATVTDVCTLAEEDFHHKNTEKPIRITATFEQLSAEAQEEFKRYYRQNRLVVFAQAKWNPDSRSAVVEQHGSRLVMKDFGPFFEAESEGKLVGDLREIYRGIRERYNELPNIATKPGMAQSLRDYEETHPEKCELRDEPNQFYGFTRGEYRLEKYIQWVYVPAVKDASTEQNEGGKTALGRLLGRTVRTKLNFTEAMDELRVNLGMEYEKILEGQQEALKGLQLSIEKRLRDYSDARAKLELKWHYDAKSSISISDPLARGLIGDGEFIGEVARAGHGLQRGFLVALLHELVGNEEKGGPQLLLGFEEPELYQHPPQAQHLMDVLERLATGKNNAQVIITTHSPYFVSSEGFKNVRMVRKIRGGRVSKVSSSDYEKVGARLGAALCEKPSSPTSLMARVSQIMQPSQRELFFCRLAVLVEGPEDVGYIATQFALGDQMSEFRRCGCHFVVGDGKCNMNRLVAIAQELNIPVFAVVDGDRDTRPKNAERNRKDNECLLNLFSLQSENPLPDRTLWHDNFVMWPKTIGDMVAAETGGAWETVENKVRKERGLEDGVRRKNPILITATLEELSKQGKQSPSLVRLCNTVLRCAQKMGMQ